MVSAFFSVEKEMSRGEDARIFCGVQQQLLVVFAHDGLYDVFIEACVLFCLETLAWRGVAVPLG